MYDRLSSTERGGSLMSDPLTYDTDDVAIRAIVTRLARPSADGGHVVERAAIMATGSDSSAIEAWILNHTGRAEQISASAVSGLHTRRLQAPTVSPRRYLLPPGALEGTAPESPN
jgi:hypothetical protein